MYLGDAKASAMSLLDDTREEVGKSSNVRMNASDFHINELLVAASDVRVLPVSANSMASLNEQVKVLLRYIESKPHRTNKLATTLGTRRDFLACRSVLISNKGHISQPILSLTSGRETPALVYVFTGQGAQWVGMAKELLESCQSFRHDIEEMDNSLKALGEAPSSSLKSWSFPPSIFPITYI